MNPRAAWIALAIVFVVAIVAGFVGFRYVSEMESRVDALAERADAADDRAAAAAARALQAEEAAQAAARDARSAEESATEERLARLAADDARRAAEDDADIARLEAEYADQRAIEAQAEADQLRQERDREMARLQDALGSIAETQRTALGLVMNLGADSINFDTDKWDLKPADRELLARIAGVLLTSKGFRLQIFGHTDDVGTVEHNQGLSERRAAAVRDYLVDAGLSPDIMTTKGFGKGKPLVPGTTDAARARNRRVEVGIIDTTVSYGETVPTRQQ